MFGVSYTYLTDITSKRRSFQNKKQSLREMVNEILAGYPNAICIMDHTMGKQLLDRFLLQWNETDWNYLKRVASVLFNTVLVANPVAEKPELSLGIPEGRERQLDNHCRLNYEISNAMEDSEFSLQLNRSRFDDKLDDNDRFYFTFEGTDEIYQIGDRVNFHKRVLTVCKTTAELKGNVLKFSYIMATPNGLKVPRIYNEALVGQAISGKVMDVTGSSVKIDFEIDKGRKSNKEQASWFPYATPYTAGGKSGWYFMPEIGDEVQLTFPGNKEEEAYAIYAVRNKQTSCTDDPQTKYLRTKDGKEIRFSPKELVITGKDKAVYIQMTEDEGITINSNTNIALEAKGKILLAAKENVNLYAESGINMISNAGGSVRMDGTTRIFGRKINDKQWTKAELKALKSTAALAGVVMPGGESLANNTDKKKEENQGSSKNVNSCKKCSKKACENVSLTCESFWASKQSTWVYPLKKKVVISDKFAASYITRGTRLHAGVDLNGEDGDEIVAMCGGKVIRILPKFYDGTDAVEVKHDDGTIARYAEIKVLVKVGDKVSKGDVLGKIIPHVSTGYTILHLEVYAGVCPEPSSVPLTDKSNSSSYLFVAPKNYQRRPDLIDPTGV